LDDYLAYFDQSPVMAVLLGLAVLLVAVALLRVALKLFLFFIILMVVALVASYFFVGEEDTNEALRRGADEVSEKVDDIIDSAEDRLKEEYKENGG
jgi:ABC-type transport system involved in cytochrome bd biosynthesis fused ATPase/permease subunit